MDADGEQVEGFQVHLGGATGLNANFGRKLRAHKVTSAGLDDYITNVVTDFLADRERRRVVRDLGRARRRGRCCAASEPLEAVLMSERAVPFHCPYCGDEDLWPHEAPRTGHGLGVPGVPARLQLKMLGLIRPSGGGGS